MDFYECIKGRRSVRRFTGEKMDRTALERIVALASHAPSWKNTQTARYIVIEDAALKKKIADDCVMGYAGNRAIIEGAPAIVLLTSVNKRSGYERDGSFSTSKGSHWESFDAGIAADTFCLAAYGEGYGTVVMGIFDGDRVAAAVNIPEGQSLSAMIAIGRPAESPKEPRRKGIDELLTII